MNLPELAKKRSLQTLVVFSVLVAGGYYIWLKKKKDALKWAQATGGNKLLKRASEPTEVTICKKACAGSSDYNACMGACIERQLQNI